MITVEHLTKRYGSFTAVDDLSFEIEAGHVYGFLGPNGAGKSTTMNIMTGCLSATAGHVQIDGYDVFEHPKEAKRWIGYLPEQPPLYLNETPEEYLHFVGEAKGIKGTALREQIDSVVEQTGLGPVRRQRIATLSKGYRQRVGIAQALLGNPKVIILDEPTVGLDPATERALLKTFVENAEGRTLIMITNHLQGVSAMDRVVFVEDGRIEMEGSPAELERTSERYRRLLAFDRGVPAPA